MKSEYTTEEIVKAYIENEISLDTKFLRKT